MATPERFPPETRADEVRILVVDDDPDARYVIVNTLAEAGFSCVEAGDAEDALEILLSAGSRGSTPADEWEEADAPAVKTAEDPLETARGATDPGASGPAAGSDEPEPTSDGERLAVSSPGRARLRQVPESDAETVEAMPVMAPDDFGLAIVDVRMPGKDGLWLLERVRETYADLQVIMLTAVDDSRTAVECLQQGAADYLVKPVDGKELVLAVNLALERRRLKLENRAYQKSLERLVRARTRELEGTLERLGQSYNQTLAALAAALDAREQETAHHSERVARQTTELVRRLGVEEEETLRAIQYGALLHDIGKIGIPDRILLKPGPLTEEEWDVMRRHPEIGHEILEGVEFLEPSLDVVLHHQERYDGSGYPDGLEGEEIPLAARAFAVVDAWDAMTHRRPYGEPMSISEALEELERAAGNRFDPRVTETFVEMIREKRLDDDQE